MALIPPARRASHIYQETHPFTPHTIPGHGVITPAISFKNLILKPDCDQCGCSSFEGVGRAHVAQWEEVDTIEVSHANPVWNFGGQGEGIFKITAKIKGQPSASTAHDDLTFNCGGISLDNHMARSQSALHTSCDFGFGSNAFPATAGGNDSIDMEYQPASPFGISDYFGTRGGRNTPYGTSAVFVFLDKSKISEGTLPAVLTATSGLADGWGESLPYSSPSHYGIGTDRLRPAFRQHFIDHQAGGVILGNISGVTASQTGTGANLQSNIFEITLSRYMPDADTLWLRNYYSKPITGVEITRWTSSAIMVNGNTFCYFPLWSKNLTLDRPAEPVDQDCARKHYLVSDMVAPWEFHPEFYYGGQAPIPNGLGDMGRPAKTGSGVLTLQNLGYIQNIPYITGEPKFAPRSEGFVSSGRFPAFTARPLFDDGTTGELKRLNFGTHDIRNINNQSLRLGGMFELPNLPPDVKGQLNRRNWSALPHGGMPCWDLGDFGPDNPIENIKLPNNHGLIPSGGYYYDRTASP